MVRQRALALAIMLAAAPVHASGDPFCAVPASPTKSDIEAILSQLYAQANLPNTYPFALRFDKTSDGAAGTATSGIGGQGIVATILDVLTRGISSVITMDPDQLNPVTSGTVLEHEEFHQTCSQINCALNFVIEAGTMVFGYSPRRIEGRLDRSFHAQEVFTHFLDYENYKATTQNEIASGNQIAAQYTANWAMLSLLVYNEGYAATKATLDQLTAALADYGTDAGLRATGTSSDGAVRITFDTFPTGQRGIQLHAGDPSSPGDALSISYVLTDSRISSSDYAAGLNYLGGAMLQSYDRYIDQLPTALPTQDIYHMMVDAGYAPANSFDADNLESDFYATAADTGQPTMTSLEKIGSIGNIPPGAAMEAPDCPTDPPYELHGYYCKCRDHDLDMMITGTHPQVDADAASFLAACPEGLDNFGQAKCTEF